MSDEYIKKDDAIAVCDVLPKLYGEAIKLLIRDLPSVKLDAEKSRSRGKE